MRAIFGSEECEGFANRFNLVGAMLRSLWEKLEEFLGVDVSLPLYFITSFRRNLWR
jgi:hypothetical protein